MRFRSSRLYLTALAGILTFGATILYSQNSSGIISGVVTDSTQALVPNANVAITNTDTGVTAWRGVTNESGVYRGPGLIPGHYSVAVEMAGFKHAQVDGILLAVDQHTDVNVTLQPGSASESVEVHDTVSTELAGRYLVARQCHQSFPGGEFAASQSEYSQSAVAHCRRLIGRRRYGYQLEPALHQRQPHPE
ncbi:MAG: carboxypeptidase-like regulatory domain-containing protein [Ignavibacteriota bacterium]